MRDCYAYNIYSSLYAVDMHSVAEISTTTLCCVVLVDVMYAYINDTGGGLQVQTISQYL